MTIWHIVAILAASVVATLWAIGMHTGFELHRKPQ